MTINVSPDIIGIATLVICMLLTWLCNTVARQAINKVVHREMQRLANMLPTVGVWVYINSWFTGSGLPALLRSIIVTAITLFILCVSFSGEVSWQREWVWHRNETVHTHDDTPPTYC